MGGAPAMTRPNIAQQPILGNTSSYNTVQKTSSGLQKMDSGLSDGSNSGLARRNVGAAAGNAYGFSATAG
jgi:hypothetical protein